MMSVTDSADWRPAKKEQAKYVAHSHCTTSIRALRTGLVLLIQRLVTKGVQRFMELRIAQSLPDRSIVDQITRTYLDSLYATKTI